MCRLPRFAIAPILPQGKMPKKLRLDQLLVGKGLFPSREQPGAP